MTDQIPRAVRDEITTARKDIDFIHWDDAYFEGVTRVKSDNRWRNLRAVDNQANHRNSKLQSNNTSGVCGVSWYRKAGEWEVYIKVNARMLHLGKYTDWFDAVCARKAADHKYGFSPNHGRKLGLPV